VSSRSSSLPPPVGGWDTENALADMPVENAVILDNWFPGTDKVTLRRGFSEYTTGMPDTVETLLEYAPPSGSQKLFAVSDGNVYDVSNSGAVGSAAVTGLTNSRFQQVQIGTAGGQFLLAMNGANTPITYNGSAWGTMSVSGPTAANLVWCNLHQRRLWFGERDSLTAWYLAVNSISGTASSFSLAGVARLGGYIMAMGTWTRDGGDGTDDVAVFITSEGEAILYSGIDPSSADTWALVGVFRIGRPIGRRCVIKAGADLVLITQDGFVAASSILSLDRSQTQKVALSAQINKAVNDAQRRFGSLFGWQPIIYPRAAMMIFNIPQSATVYHQYVFNTITGGPCRFTGINAVCWGMRGEEIYFGAPDGNVYLFDVDGGDNGANIMGDALQAFSYFRTPSQVKSFKLVEPIFQSNGDPHAAVDLNTDFTVSPPIGTPTPSATVNSALWGVSKWGIGLWGASDQIYRGWRGIRGRGRSASVRIRVASLTARPSWVATNITYVPGGQI
jgi:hypothetical protein